MKNTSKSDTYRSISINNIKAPASAKPSVHSTVISSSTDLRVKGGKK